MKIEDRFMLDPLPVTKAVPPLIQDEGEKAPGKFDEIFNTVFSASNTASQEASAESRETTALLMTGQLDDLSGHMLAGEKSSMLFELNLSVRNKVLDAYSEVVRMQI